ncbi:MAG: shikimate kinase [Chitinophagales bacterium]
MSRIFLIGFMGSGKTFLGKQLAQLLNYEFIDLDEAIEKEGGVSIAEIFSANGEEYFRNEESSVLKSISQKQNVVVATGGGTPCFYDNMKWMNDHGLTVYLKLTPEFLFQRLKPETLHRPLLSGKSEEQLKFYISSKLDERKPYYAMSHITVKANEIAAPAIATLITEF